MTTTSRHGGWWSKLLITQNEMKKILVGICAYTADQSGIDKIKA